MLRTRPACCSFTPECSVDRSMAVSALDVPCPGGCPPTLGHTASRGRGACLSVVTPSPLASPIRDPLRPPIAPASLHYLVARAQVGQRSSLGSLSGDETRSDGSHGACLAPASPSYSRLCSWVCGPVAFFRGGGLSLAKGFDGGWVVARYCG